MRPVLPASREKGTVAIAVAFSLVALLGFLGLVVDLGRLYVMKAELYNAADACALAAAYELSGDADALVRAENAGMAIGARNSVNFQSTPVAIEAADIRFSNALSPNSGYLTRAEGAPADARYAMCTLNLPNVPMTVARLLGIGDQAVGARAVATLAPAQTSCALPMGVCLQGAGPGFGMTPGDWLQARFDAGGGSTGSFNWIDFTPPQGGANEVGEMLTGTGTCNTGTSSQVGQTGILGNAAARAWNTRFGLYQGGQSGPESAPPDFTGYAYTPTNWPSQRNALPDFLANRRSVNAPYQGNAQTGLAISGGYRAITAAEHASHGASRRLAVAPIVDCAAWASSQTVAIQGYACVLMLHPIGSPQDNVLLEYVGRADDPSTPCATSGLAGGSHGPLVPVLVQ